MAGVTKSVSGATTTFVVTDSTGAALTLTATTGVTGLTLTYSGTSIHEDGIAMANRLLLQLATGLIPGDGAQTLIP